MRKSPHFFKPEKERKKSDNAPPRGLFVCVPPCEDVATDACFEWPACSEIAQSWYLSVLTGLTKIASVIHAFPLSVSSENDGSFRWCGEESKFGGR